MLIGYIDWMTDVSCHWMNVCFYMLINEYRVCSLYHTFSFHNLHRMFWFSSLDCPFLVTLRF